MAKSKRHNRQTLRPAAFQGWQQDLRIDALDRRNIIVVAAVAAILRIAFFALSSANNPLLLNPIMDGLYHHEWAEAIIGGNFWGDEVFFRAPLYPYFVAFIYKLTGGSIGAVIVVQHLLGVATCILIYLLARSFFTGTISFVAGLLAATYWPFIYFEGDLLIVSLVLLLNTAALLALSQTLTEKGTTHSTTLLAVAGVAIGFSAIARPSVLVFLPGIPLVYYLSQRMTASGAARPRRSWIARTLIVYAFAALVILPVLIRNYVVGGDIVPISSQGGVNFYIGNNPKSDGRTAVVPGTRPDWWGGYQDAIAMAERARGHSLKPSEVSGYFFGEAFAFIFGSPDESVPLTFRKLRMFWSGGERSNNKYIYFFWRQSGMPWIPMPGGGSFIPLPGFWLVAPLGVVGVVLLWRKRRPMGFLYTFLVLYTAGVVAFFVNARFRLPVVPVLIVFGAYAAGYLWHGLRQRDRATWKVVTLLAVLFIAVNADFVDFKEHTRYADSVSHYSLGNAHLRMNDADAAIEQYEMARTKHARYPAPGYQQIARNVDYNLGRLYATRGSCDRALPLLQRVGGNDRATLLAQQLIAGCYTEMTEYALADRAWRQLVASGDETTRTRLIENTVLWARDLVAKGDRDGAVALLRRATSEFPHDGRLQGEYRNLTEGTP